MYLLRSIELDNSTIKQWADICKDSCGVISEIWKRLTYRECDQFHYIRNNETGEVLWCMCVWLGKFERTLDCQYHMHIYRSFSDFVREKNGIARYPMNAVQFHRNALAFNKRKFFFAPPLPKMKEILTKHFCHQILPFTPEGRVDYSAYFGPNYVLEDSWPRIINYNTVVAWDKC